MYCTRMGDIEGESEALIEEGKRTRWREGTR
jgi:hypothetical protein